MRRGTWFLISLANEPPGTKAANYDIGPTGAFPDRPPIATVGSVAIGISKISSLGITFVPGKKDIAPSLDGLRADEERIVASVNWTILFYDVLARKAWLLDGPSALLHICRAWLSSEQAELLCTGTNVDPISVFQHADLKGGVKEAIKLLRCPNNCDIELYPTKKKPTIESSIDFLTNARKVEKKMVASWQTWGDIVKARVLALELLHDELIKNRSVRAGNVPSLRQHLRGYDFQEVMRIDARPQTWEAELKSSSGGWLDFANSNNAVPIFGTHFGDLLRPTKPNVLGGLQTCSQLTSLPEGHDYLGVSVHVLQRLWNKRLKHAVPQSGDSHCIKLGHKTYWLNPAAAFPPCTCAHVACRLSIAKLASRPSSTSHATSLETLFDENPYGAVVFPCKTYRLRKQLDSPSHITEQALQQHRIFLPNRLLEDSGAGRSTSDDVTLPARLRNDESHSASMNGGKDALALSEPDYPLIPRNWHSGVREMNEAISNTPPRRADGRSGETLAAHGGKSRDTASDAVFPNNSAEDLPQQRRPRRVTARSELRDEFL